MGTDLTPAVSERLERRFSGEDLAQARSLLEEECGDNLPLIHGGDVERVRIAVLQQSGGTLDQLADAIGQAQTDWRDVLMGAGFGKDLEAHLRWWPE